MGNTGLNKNPQGDEAIVTVHATTRKDTRKAVRLPDVLVEINAGEHHAIKEDSIIDCESWKVWKKSILIDGINKKQIEALDVLPPKILEKLRAAIGKSKTLYPIDKRLIFPE